MVVYIWTAIETIAWNDNQKHPEDADHSINYLVQLLFILCLSWFHEKNALIMSCSYVIIMIMLFIKLEPQTKKLSSAHWTKLKYNLHPVEIPWVKNNNKWLYKPFKSQSYKQAKPTLHTHTHNIYTMITVYLCVYVLFLQSAKTAFHWKEW